jgi:hypothetical protein
MPSSSHGWCARSPQRPQLVVVVDEAVLVASAADRIQQDWPPIDAIETVIEVREVAWKRYGLGTYKVVFVDVGPWRFTLGH